MLFDVYEFKSSVKLNTFEAESCSRCVAACLKLNELNAIDERYIFLCVPVFILFSLTAETLAIVLSVLITNIQFHIL